MKNKKTRFYLNDNNPNIVIKYIEPATIQVFRNNELDWITLQADNSYIREILDGQGNNCLTETTNDKVEEIIKEWSLK